MRRKVRDYSLPLLSLIHIYVDKEDKTSYLIQVSGSNYKANTALINESGLYALILSSKLPSAKAVSYTHLDVYKRQRLYFSDLLINMASSEMQSHVNAAISPTRIPVRIASSTA